jgi:hypothetical protein
MIIKVKVSGSVWQMFDGVRRLTQTVHDSHDVTGSTKVFPDVGMRIDVFDFVNNRPCTEDEARGGVVELWLFGKDDNDTKQILAFKPVFIMNDEGRTVERI